MLEFCNILPSFFCNFCITCLSCIFQFLHLLHILHFCFERTLKKNFMRTLRRVWEKLEITLKKLWKNLEISFEENLTKLWALKKLWRIFEKTLKELWKILERALKEFLKNLEFSLNRPWKTKVWRSDGVTEWRSEWRSEWVCDRTGSREASASKNKKTFFFNFCIFLFYAL